MVFFSKAARRVFAPPGAHADDLHGLGCHRRDVEALAGSGAHVERPGAAQEERLGLVGR